eukprot:5888765-Amphidinium_carterae.1
MAVIDSVITKFGDAGLQVNLSRGKSELLLRLIGPKAKGVMQHIHQCAHAGVPVGSELASKGTLGEMEGSVYIADDNSKSLTTTIDNNIHINNHNDAGITDNSTVLYFDYNQCITISACYPYLGKSTNPQMSQQKEVNIRKARTINSFNQHRLILTSKRYATSCRLQFLKTLCIVHLRHEHHSTPFLTPTQHNQLSRTYISVLKRTCHFPKEGRLWQVITDEMFLNYIGEPKLEYLFLQQRLAFLQRLLLLDNELVRAMMTITSKKSFWEQWIKDLTSLQALAPALQALPQPSMATISDWATYIVLAQNEWIMLLRRTLVTCAKPEYMKSNLIPWATLLHEDLQEEGGSEHGAGHEEQAAQQREPLDERPHLCVVCGASFTKYRGLALHRRRSHHIISPIALRTYGTECVICHSQLKTRTHLLQHYNNRLTCSLQLMET